MAVTLTTTARNGSCDALVDTLDSGKVKILTSGDVLLLTFTFGATAFGAAGAAVAGRADANAIADVVAVATGTATKFTLHQSDDTQMASGAVSTTGSDVNLDTVSIDSGVTYGMGTFYITLPATPA